jgi:hypothetical protein
MYETIYHDNMDIDGKPVFSCIIDCTTDEGPRMVTLRSRSQSVLVEKVQTFTE